MMFAQVNSEHCRHKIFNAQFTVDGAAQPHSLFEMIKLSHRASPQGVLSAYKDNAAVVAGPQAIRFFPQADHVWREHRETAWPELLAFWGAPNLQVINRTVHRDKCTSEARDRARAVARVHASAPAQLPAPVAATTR